MPIRYIEKPQDFSDGKLITLPYITDEVVGIGRIINPQLVITAYRQGIFPWMDSDELVLWWATNPRMVLQTEKLKISHSLRKRLKAACQLKYRDARGVHDLHITLDHNPKAVMQKCETTPRHGQNGTWITQNVKEAYLQTFPFGFLHSVECYLDGELKGGLYGCSLGKMFYGESMFTECSDLSKIALCVLVAICKVELIPWIDCQQETAHLSRMGASPVPLSVFKKHLDEFCTRSPVDWSKYQNCLVNQVVTLLD